MQLSKLDKSSAHCYSPICYVWFHFRFYMTLNRRLERVKSSTRERQMAVSVSRTLCSISFCLSLLTCLFLRPIILYFLYAFRKSLSNLFLPLHFLSLPADILVYYYNLGIVATLLEIFVVSFFLFLLFFHIYDFLLVW